MISGEQREGIADNHLLTIGSFLGGLEDGDFGYGVSDILLLIRSLPPGTATMGFLYGYSQNQREEEIRRDRMVLYGGNQKQYETSYYSFAIKIRPFSYSSKTYLYPVIAERVHPENPHLQPPPLYAVTPKRKHFPEEFRKKVYSAISEANPVYRWENVTTPEYLERYFKLS
jgi:hypothetical protein